MKKTIYLFSLIILVGLTSSSLPVQKHEKEGEHEKDETNLRVLQDAFQQFSLPNGP